MIFSLFAAVMFLTYWPLRGTGFSDHDSMFTAIHVWDGSGYFDWVRRLGEKHGRWHYYYTYSIAAIPFLSTSFVYYKVTTIGILLLNAAVFYYVVRRILGATFAGLTLVFFLLSLQIGGNHSLLAGYFYFLHVPMLLLALSFLAFWKYLELRKRAYLYGSLLLFALAVPFHETIILYTAIYVLLIWFKGGPDGNRRTWTAWLPIAPYLAIAAAFIGSTLLFRYLHPTEYVGNTFDASKFSVAHMFRALFQFTIPALPGYFFFNDRFEAVLSHYADDYSGSRGQTAYMLTHLRPEWFARAAAFAGLAVLSLLCGTSIRTWHLLAIAVTGVTLMIIPNALISLSPHYQHNAADGIYVASHMTYLAHFGVALVLTAALWRPATVLIRHRWASVRMAAVSVVAVLVMGLSFVTDFTNYHAAHMLDMSRQKWVAMDRFGKTAYFEQLPPGSVIYAPDLWKSVFNPYYTLRNFAGDHLIQEPETGPSYWTKYLASRTGKVVHIYAKPELVKSYVEQHAEPTPHVYFLRYLQDPRIPREAVAIGEVSLDYPTQSDALELLTINWPEPVRVAVEQELRRPGKDGEMTRSRKWLNLSVPEMPPGVDIPTRRVTSPGMRLDSLVLFPGPVGKKK